MLAVLRSTGHAAGQFIIGAWSVAGWADGGNGEWDYLRGMML